MSGGGGRRRTGSSWHSGFSRLFSRTPSKEPEEGSEVAPPRQGASSFETNEHESAHVVGQRKESNPLPELLKFSISDNKNLSTEELSRSSTQEELKKAKSLPSLAHEGKTSSNNRQIKEGFFQYLGSLFGISSKSSFKDNERATVGDVQNKTEKDISDVSSHHKSGPSEHLKSEIFVISTTENELGASSKNEDIKAVETTSSGSWHLQKPQKQFAEASKKTTCDLGAPSVTYATYRGSTRIKQLLKKQAELEQEEGNLTSINSSTTGIKENQTANFPNSEITIKTNPESEDDKKDLQANISLAEMDLEGSSKDILDSGEHRELKNKSTFMTEMETIKNCIEELVSVKHSLVSNTPEGNRNLFLEPVLLPKEANSSCQNRDPVKMNSENSRLLGEGEKMLGEIQMQLQSNSAAIVGSQKAMHICAFSNKERKETTQHEFSFHPSVHSTDNEQPLLEDKSSAYSWTEEFKSKSPSQVCSLNNTVSKGEAVDQVVNIKEDTHKNVKTEHKEQNYQVILQDELPVLLQNSECKEVTLKVDVNTPAEPTDIVTDRGTFNKNGTESENSTGLPMHAGMQNNSNFSVISETEINDAAIRNLCVPAMEFGHVGMTEVPLDATEINNTNTCLLVVEYNNMESQVACSPDLTVVPVDGVIRSSEAKDDSCHHFAKRDEADILVKTSGSLKVPLQLENNTGTATTPKHIFSPLNSLAKSAETNVPLFNEMRNHLESKIILPALETEDVTTVSPTDICLPKDSLPDINLEKNNTAPIFNSPSLTDFVANSFIFEDNMHLDTVPKIVPNYEKQSLLEASGSLTDKQENIKQSLRAPAVVGSAESNCSRVSPLENVPHSKVSGFLCPLSAAESENLICFSNASLEAGNTVKNNIHSDPAEISDTRCEIWSCSEERDNKTESCPVHSKSVLAKEDLPISAVEKTSSSATCSEDTSKCCSPVGETTDVVFLHKINFLPIKSENFAAQISLKRESNFLPPESPSEHAYLSPLLQPVAYNVTDVEPVKAVLGVSSRTQESKDVQETSSGQPSLHSLAGTTSKNPAEMDNPAVTALSAELNGPFFEKTLKDVETEKRVQNRSPDLTVLFKIADELVDAVLHLAIEELRSKQTACVCQTNDIKDNLLEPGLQKDEKTRKMLSKSKEIPSRNSALIHVNESCIRKLAGVKGEETLGTDKRMSFGITDEIDLALIAKEIVDEVINAAKQNLMCNHEENLSKTVSQNSGLGSKTKVSEELKTVRELTDECCSVSSDAVPRLIGQGKVASSFTPLKEESKDQEIIPNNVFPCQTNGDEQLGPIVAVEPSHTEVDNNKNTKDTNYITHRTDAGDSIGNWTADNKSKISTCSINGEVVITEEQLLSCPLVSVSVTSCTSDSETYTCTSGKAKDEYVPIGSLGDNMRKVHPECIFKEVKDAAFLREKSHESCYEIIGEGGYSKVEKSCIASDLSIASQSPKTSPKSDFAQEEEAVAGQDFSMANVFKESYLDVHDDRDEAKSPKVLTFSPPAEWEGNSSFTILYEDALYNESDCISTEETEHPLSPPDHSLDNNQQLAMCVSGKGKLESDHLYKENDQSRKMLDNTCPETFLTVEAKRYRVYPFSLSPIYEDDSSQEDIHSTDISPGGHLNEKSTDSQSLSVLSLLQSVSERLKSSNCYNEEEEEELCEGSSQENEEEAYIDSHYSNNSSTAVPENITQSELLFRCSHFLSSEALNTEEALPFKSTYSAHLLQKSDSSIKSFSRSAYSERLHSRRNYLGEKENQFGSILLPKDQQPENSSLQKLTTSQGCPVDRERLKCNPRPGKMVICGVYGNIKKHEIYHDVVDATAWVLSKEVLIRVVRGCWVLYEKPRYQGQKYILEEGEKMLSDILNLHCEEHQGNITIGSVRQIMKDCSVPEIQLYPQDGSDCFAISIQSAVTDVGELRVRNPALSVKAGVWLAYSDVNYKGTMMVLEENHGSCETSAADIKSLRPLKMGGLKVQMPHNVKMIIYEKSHFGGWCKEISENTDCVPMVLENAGDFQGVGSVRVIGGIWVAYEKERYKGQQYLLEEGEYEDWHSWGGTNNSLMSLRFLQADFMDSEVTLSKTGEDDGKLLNIVNQEIPDLELAGFGLVTRSINVKSGVWVAYQQKYFCGEQYVLEKGKYKCFLDWGGSSDNIMSIRPVKLEPLGNNEPTHWIKAFNKTHFQGTCIDFTEEATDLESFTPCSFKVLRGCWLLCYQGETGDNWCVLEEDLYADLASCGCPAAAVKSLKPVEYVFAEPFISLFALENYEGKELRLQEAVSSVLNKDLHFLTQSVWVRSGLWIAYEGCHFLGKQFLLEPTKISNWTQFSGWKLIGSLRPVKQPAVYFRIKNRSQDKYLTVTGKLMDARATSVCLSPLNCKNTQIWRYSCGLIKSKANDACLDVIGGRDVSGAKVALWIEHGKARQKWTFNKDGTISSYLSDQLVLDVKGGYYYDRNHIVVNQADNNECSQKWDFEIL
nr:very large A-kinase anchor protein isoform X1 [Pogona vitticeps]XP_020666048.1 very large A-kinase anchor protein isoform X2 [Pogona vitticeps]